MISKKICAIGRKSSSLDLPPHFEQFGGDYREVVFERQRRSSVFVIFFTNKVIAP